MLVRDQIDRPLFPSIQNRFSPELRVTNQKNFFPIFLIAPFLYHLSIRLQLVSRDSLGTLYVTYVISLYLDRYVFKVHTES